MSGCLMQAMNKVNLLSIRNTPQHLVLAYHGVPVSGNLDHKDAFAGTLYVCR